MNLCKFDLMNIKRFECLYLWTRKPFWFDMFDLLKHFGVSNQTRVFKPGIYYFRLICAELKHPKFYATNLCLFDVWPLKFKDSVYNLKLFFDHFMWLSMKFIFHFEKVRSTHVFEPGIVTYVQYVNSVLACSFEFNVYGDITLFQHYEPNTSKSASCLCVYPSFQVFQGLCNELRLQYLLKEKRFTLIEKGKIDSQFSTPKGESGMNSDVMRPSFLKSNVTKIFEDTLIAENRLNPVVVNYLILLDDDKSILSNDKTIFLFGKCDEFIVENITKRQLRVPNMRNHESYETFHLCVCDEDLNFLFHYSHSIYLNNDLWKQIERFECLKTYLSLSRPFDELWIWKEFCPYDCKNDVLSLPFYITHTCLVMTMHDPHSCSDHFLMINGCLFSLIHLPSLMPNIVSSFAKAYERLIVPFIQGELHKTDYFLENKQLDLRTSRFEEGGMM